MLSDVAREFLISGMMEEDTIELINDNLSVYTVDELIKTGLPTRIPSTNIYVLGSPTRYKLLKKKNKTFEDFEKHILLVESNNLYELVAAAQALSNTNSLGDGDVLDFLEDEEKPSLMDSNNFEASSDSASLGESVERLDFNREDVEIDFDSSETEACVDAASAEPTPSSGEQPPVQGRVPIFYIPRKSIAYAVANVDTQSVGYTVEELALKVNAYFA